VGGYWISRQQRGSPMWNLRLLGRWEMRDGGEVWRGYDDGTEDEVGELRRRGNILLPRQVHMYLLLFVDDSEMERGGQKVGTDGCCQPMSSNFKAFEVVRQLKMIDVSLTPY
jgi:hypothetical protein